MDYLTDSAAVHETTSHWSMRSTDPNDSVVLPCRARVLADAWRPAVEDRTAFLIGRVRGKRVLDVGCVAHDEERMSSDGWLHRHLAEAADECIGVDVLEDAVEAMVNAGFNAVVADLSTDSKAVDGLFQVIVAGELIEHVVDLDMLFQTAVNKLTVDGELIITTPNPYAPARVRAGRRCEIWENVDHIVYAFPSGIAELAERHGLVLSEALTTNNPPSKRTSPLRWLKRTIRRSHYHRRGYATGAGDVRSVVLDRRDRLDRLADMLTRHTGSPMRFTGETAIYVVTRGPLQ